VSHDRARLSALVDGELDHDARERVLAHLAQCDECRAVVETERRVKALLSGMPEAAPGGDFLARLNSLSDPNTEPLAEPPAPAKRRIVGRGRAAGSKRSAPMQPTQPTQPTQPWQPNAQAGGQQVATLRLPLPLAGAHQADADAGTTVGEPEADALETGVRRPAAFHLGLLRIGEQRAGAGAGGLSEGDLSSRMLNAGEPVARSSRGRFSGPSRPAATRPFGYPDLYGSRRPGRLRSGRLRSSRFGRRFTVGVAGAASIAGMALVTAFTVGGAGAPTADVKVVPPIQRYTVQHADSAVNLPYSDPGAATATIGDSNLTGLLSPNR
jgi:anti-sigma factor RsiW